MATSGSPPVNGRLGGGGALAWGRGDVGVGAKV
jgi:hypothetical protein